MFTNLRGHNAWYERHGDAGPQVLLVMGFGMSCAAWKPQIDGLSADHRVLTYDNRGSGRSELGPGLHGVRSLADDAAALLDHLGWGDAHVIGVSMGGMVAQHLAIRHEGRVRSLSLIATHPGGGLRHTLPTPRGLRWFVEANMRSGDARINALRQLLYPADAIGPSVPEATLKAISQTASARARLCHLASIITHDATEGLARLVVPTLVVRPAQDLLVPPSNSDRIHELMTSSRMVEFAEAGHGITSQCSARLNDLLRSHVAAHA